MRNMFPQELHSVFTNMVEKRFHISRFAFVLREFQSFVKRRTSLYSGLSIGYNIKFGMQGNQGKFLKKI